MKKWQAEAIRKINAAAAQAKKDVIKMGPTARYDYVHGEIDVWLVENYPEHTLSRKMFYPF